MNGLALGLAGANAFYDQTRKLEQYDHDKALRDAELSNLDAKTAADRSKYQLSDAQSRADSSLLPQRTANQQAQLGLTANDLAGQKARQPTELQTKNLNATAERDKALISKSIAEVDAADLPRTIQLHKQAGILKDAEVSHAALAGLAKFVQATDSAGAAKFINDMNEVAPDGAKLTGRVASVGLVNSDHNDKNSPRVLVALGEDGKPVKRQDGSVYQVPEQLLKAKTEYQFMHNNHGDVYVGNKTTGGVTQPIKADPAAAAARNGHTPADLQIWDRLIKTGVAKDDKEAWAMVRQAREKSRPAFIEEYVTKGAGMGKSASELAKEANEAYDLARSAGAPPAQPPGAPSSDWGQWAQ